MSLDISTPNLKVGRKPHLDELDRLRIITALSVVAVHVLGNTTFLDRTPSALVLQDAFVTLFHFTREVFMFVTALALVYVYSGKPLNVRRFARRRTVGVLLPYAAWSVIYQVATTHSTTLWQFLGTLAFNLVTGNASYQLYYILLTIEFYLVFPWFLNVLPALARRPWKTLAVSAALECVIMLGLHDVLPRLPLSAGMTANIALFFNRFALTYQLYFIMGGLAAYHLKRIKVFALRHGAWMIAAGALGLAILEGHYLVDTLAGHVVPNSAIAVLQIPMVPYSIGAIAFLYWLTLAQAERANTHNAHRTRRIWSALSDTAFGVYLIHPIILTAMLSDVVPQLRWWPTGALAPLIWLLTAGFSVAITLLMLRIPVVSRLMGRERPAPEWLRIKWNRKISATRSVLAAGPTASQEPIWRGAVQGEGVISETD